MVDADKRHMAAGQLARSAQHGAVAAHDDGQVGLLANGCVVGNGVFGNAGVFGGIGFYQHFAASRLQRGGQFAQRGIQAAVLIPADKSNGFKVHKVNTLLFDGIIGTD